jgi:hypothetical protein
MNRVWTSRTGTISETSPNTYAPTGRPRLPALTYDAASAPTVVSPASRRHSRRTTSTYAVATAAVLATNAASAGEKTLARSLVASVSKSRAGAAT